MAKQTEAEKQRSGLSWKISLAIVCVGILAYGVFFSEIRTVDPAHLLGFNLPIAVFIWIIFNAIFYGKRGANALFHTFIVIYASLIVSNLLAVIF